MPRRITPARLALLALPVLAGLVIAGPLNPPAGPVTGTYKTLTEVEPRIAINATNTPGDGTSLYRITQPGSYYLTGNITGVSGKHGIAIGASRVTIDLNGFAMTGVAGSFAGIKSDSGLELSGLAVRNGSVTNWGHSGIDLQTFVTSGNLIERIYAGGNVGDGIACGRSAVVSDCIAENNGVIGFNLITRGTLRHCHAYANGNNGYDLAADTNVTDCLARLNHADGFHGSGILYVHCDANSNSGAGFNLGSQGVLLDSHSEGNTTYGAYLSASSMVSRCLLAGNASAGIYVAGQDCRVEQNSCSGNGIGVQATAAGNFIARNTVTGSTSVNWSIAAGNACLVVNAAVGGAINGNAGGAAPGGGDSNANFTY